MASNTKYANLNDSQTATLTFTGASGGDWVKVTNYYGADAYWTADGSTPSRSGDGVNYTPGYTVGYAQIPASNTGPAVVKVFGWGGLARVCVECGGNRVRLEAEHALGLR